MHRLHEPVLFFYWQRNTQIILKKDYFEKYIMNILIILSFREEVGWYYFALTKKYSFEKKSDVKLFYEDMLNFMN